MMAIRYRDGKYNLAAGTRSAFAGLSAALEAEGHPPMVVTDGDREDADQLKIWYERMVLFGQINGRKVYGTRVWQGKTWYQIHPDTVGLPGSSNHEKRRANDLGSPYNSTSTAAHKRARVLAPRFNISCEGLSFGEAWHWTFWGALGVIGNTTAGGASSPAPPPTPAPIEEDEMYLYVQIQGQLTTWILWVPGRGKYQTTQDEKQALKWRALVGKDARILTDPEVAEFINVAGLFKG